MFPPKKRQPAVALDLPFSLRGTFPPEEGVVSMNRNWAKKLVVAAAATVLAGSLAFAQQTTIEEGKRKVKVKTQPSVPELARRMNITGKVRIEVVIAADGHVKTSRAVGGHPVLVQSCLDAVKDWKFEAAPEETTQMIEFDFRQ
jgi:TonB family protein